MAMQYFEVGTTTDRMYYFSCAAELGNGGIRRFMIASVAQRIWQEDETQVKFVKNRLLPLDTPVDQKEFFWVKLQSKPCDKD